MKLTKNEQIIVDTEICKITNFRVVTGKTSSNQIFKEKKSVEFDDINSYEMIMNMGEESKIKTGLKYLCVKPGANRVITGFLQPAQN